MMNVKEIKPTGMFKAWKSSVFEVTAAREEKESFVDPRQVADLTAKTVKTLNQMCIRDRQTGLKMIF